jgi:hypothetical protein
MPRRHTPALTTHRVSPLRHSCRTNESFPQCDARHTRATQIAASHELGAPSHTPRRTAMRHLSAVRDILIPLAGIAFFVMLFVLLT